MCGSSSTTRMLSGFVWPGGTGAASAWAARAPIGSSSVKVARPGIQRDVSTVLLHDPLADGEPQSGAFAFPLGREERLEYVGREILGHAGARVLYADRYAVADAPR